MRFQGGRNSYQYSTVQTRFKHELSVFVATGQSRQGFCTYYNGRIFLRKAPKGGPLRCWNDPDIYVSLPAVSWRCRLLLEKSVFCLFKLRGYTDLIIVYWVVRMLGSAREPWSWGPFT